MRSIEDPCACPGLPCLSLEEGARRIMTLDPGILFLVLAAAAMHAGWNALVKAGGDRLVMLTLVMVAPVPICAVLLLFLPPPAMASLPYLATSVLVHLFYYGFLVGAYRHGDLSQVYPIARGAAPAMVAVAAWPFAGEALAGTEVMGVVIVSAGIMSLAWRGRDGRGPQELKGLGFAALTALTIAIYLIADGLGGRLAGSTLAYICWLFILEGLLLFAITCYRRRGRIVASFSADLFKGLIGGLVAGISYGIAIWAMSVSPLAHIVALRETSVIMAAVIGTLLLKEPFGPRRIAAAGLVALGAVLLNLPR